MQATNRQWIFKPAAQAQGRGIFVTNKISEIPQKNNNSNYVVSEYIANPLLLNGYKFDMRIYVAVTCINPLRIYMFEEGLARFATCKYDQSGATHAASGQKAKFMHLTNYSINKKNAAFMHNKDEINDGEGSKWSLTALRKLMRQLGIDDKAIWRSIEDIIIKTIISAEPQINQASEQYVPYQSNCFELLGFDILIDDLLQAWLIEVNLSPSLGCDSPLDQKIKGNLIADLFTLVGVVPLEQRRVVGADSKYQKLNGMYSAGMKQKQQAAASRTQQQIYGSESAATLLRKEGVAKKEGKQRGQSVAQGEKKGSRMRSRPGKQKRGRDNSTGLNNVYASQHGGPLGWAGSTKIGQESYGYQPSKPLTKDEGCVVKEAEEEFKRRGHFKRLFPSMEYSYYRQFFLNDERPLNKLLDERIMEKRRQRTAAMIQLKSTSGIEAFR